ncbi:N-acetyltransferase [Vibrio zhanjiangensis]|uniref:N-acetyltransferase n=1 Tax=Vibrio zhanjiangensis TaxID=1046128 RepID=A0ABQ6F1J3_9VIBR|nr:GNAT family N-acetyltransferase [Vibrio zhanjiangensis]GLT18597.1 N-acetyltransferase [Vibrio zhanjiangensis]
MASTALENNIELDKFDLSYTSSIKKIHLNDEQVKFAGTAKDFLNGGSDTTHLHVIKVDERVIGFFKIDTLYCESFSFCPKNGLGLKAFAIDINYQGKGLGSKVVKALLPYLAANYSQYESVYLTVNCKNPAAKSCYHNGGFIDAQQLYLGGEAGPQHIMYADISDI